MIIIFFPKHYGIDDIHLWFRQRQLSYFHVAEFTKTEKGFVFEFKFYCQ